MYTSAYKATFFTFVAVLHEIHGTQDPNCYVLQNCKNCSKQYLPASTHPLLIKYTWLMSQLLAMHLASYKCHFVQAKVGKSSKFYQYNGCKHSVFIHKQQLQFSALSVKFSEMLLWRLHPPLLRNQSVKTYGKRWFCNLKTFSHQQFRFEYDTKQKYMRACL